MKIKLPLLTIVSILFLFTFCKKNDNSVPTPQQNVENEIITTVKILYRNISDSSKVITATFKDPDGTGGIPYTIFDTIKLFPNEMYDVEIVLLDETKNPSVLISEEVEELGDQHQFFFTPSADLDMHISYSDSDVNGVPIGLSSHVMTGKASTTKNGKLKVQLKHQGTEKPKSGGGNPAIGSTDIEIDFPVTIQ